jgi:hypothetical protein
MERVSEEVKGSPKAIRTAVNKILKNRTAREIEELQA